MRYGSRSRVAREGTARTLDALENERIKRSSPETRSARVDDDIEKVVKGMCRAARNRTGAWFSRDGERRISPSSR